MFFSPFSIAITSLGEERANLSAFRTFVRFALVWFCLFPLPLGVWEGLRFVIVALPRLFSYLFCPLYVPVHPRVGISGHSHSRWNLSSIMLCTLSLKESHISSVLLEGIAWNAWAYFVNSLNICPLPEINCSSLRLGWTWYKAGIQEHNVMITVANGKKWLTSLQKRG